MIVNSKHLVNTVFFDLNTSSAKQAVDLQEELSLFSNNELPGLLEAEFDRFNKNGSEIIIDKMVIDLGLVKSENFKTILAEKLVSQLRINLKKNIQDSHLDADSQDASVSDSQAICYFLENGSLPWFCEPGQINLSEIFIELVQNENKQFFDFIRQNLKNSKIRKRLLYQFSESDITKLIKALFNINFDFVENIVGQVFGVNELVPVFETFPCKTNFTRLEILLGFFAKCQANQKQYSEKMLFHYFAEFVSLKPTVFLEKLMLAVKNVIDKGHRQFLPFKEILESVYLIEKENPFNNYKEVEKSNDSLDKSSLETAADNQSSESELSGSNYIKNEPGDDQKNTNDSVFQESKFRTGFKSESVKFLNDKDNFEKSTETQQREDSIEFFENQENNNPQQTSIGKLSDKSSKVFDDLKSEVKPVSENNPEAKRDREPAYFITNAGLILLNPFLPQLFRKLSITSEGKFTSESSIHKAVHLLQYVVNPESPLFEEILVLNKILCGLPVSEPVKFQIDLAPYEKREATILVKAAIKNWAVLKNTSVSGFRKSFLERKGILKFSENKWTLRIQRTAYDILLDSIPWSYSVVRFSWMDNLIETEW